ncbi:hypothetical protein K402DRAFT_401939 [Aulographum hederae CBS 113979]|uniref:Uncharacterized protein n=1 Tax=Aulographum hederae CBS 113979 TaxID=1176131 RepID=A0A6G1H886_9PEZI|nr:hypothetical protein K402DRAFT_401939 [Aulographum hederae CBS 113979]
MFEFRAVEAETYSSDGQAAIPRLQGIARRKFSSFRSLVNSTDAAGRPEWRTVVWKSSQLVAGRLVTGRKNVVERRTGDLCSMQYANACKTVDGISTRKLISFSFPTRVDPRITNYPLFLQHCNVSHASSVPLERLFSCASSVHITTTSLLLFSTRACLCFAKLLQLLLMQYSFLFPQTSFFASSTHPSRISSVPVRPQLYCNPIPPTASCIPATYVAEKCPRRTNKQTSTRQHEKAPPVFSYCESHGDAGYGTALDPSRNVE